MIEHTMTYDEVAQTWRSIVHDGLKLKYQRNTLEHMRESWQSAGTVFYGGTCAEMTERVDGGWLAPGMEVKTGSPQVDRMRVRRHDMDGELDVELALQGDDRPYLLRQKRRRQAGLQINIQYNFLATTEAAVLADYGRWIASLIAGLQGRAFDLQIDVFSVVRMPFGKTTLDLVRTNVRVKRFGKRSSLKSWGALFSPTGYRMLGFCARMMACSEHGRLCNPGMGASVAPGFDVKLDGRVLTSTCAPGASSFPREYMDSKLAGLSF
jgi:hypothetical protein